MSIHVERFSTEIRWPEVTSVGKVLPCADCEGTGRVEDTELVMRFCRLCDGKGRYPQFTDFDPRFVQ